MQFTALIMIVLLATPASAAGSGSAQLGESSGGAWKKGT